MKSLHVMADGSLYILYYVFMFIEQEGTLVFDIKLFIFGYKT